MKAQNSAPNHHLPGVAASMTKDNPDPKRDPETNHQAKMLEAESVA